MSNRGTTQTTSGTALVFSILAIVPALFAFRPVLGVLLAIFALIPALAGIILGHRTRRHAKSGTANTALILGYLALAMALFRLTIWPFIAATTP